MKLSKEKLEKAIRKLNIYIYIYADKLSDQEVETFLSFSKVISLQCRIIFIREA